MNKKIYNPLVIEVLSFDTQDVVGASGGDTDVGEGEVKYVPGVEIEF